MSQNIVQALKQALVALDKASIPEDLRAVAFASAFWAARESQSERPDSTSLGSPTPKTNKVAQPSNSPGENGNEVLKRLAQKLDLSEEEIEFVYEFNSDLSLCIPPSRLAPVLREAVVQIIYLVAAGRQGCGLDAKTSAQLIKDVCAERGKADTNFSRTLKDLHGQGLVVGGTGRQKTVTVNAAGFEMAGTIIKELRGSVN